MSEVTAGTNLTSINDNFTELARQINDLILFRDNPLGESNTVQGTIDLNSNALINAKNPPTDPSDVVTLQHLDTLSGFNDAAALAQAVTDAETAETGAQTAETGALAAEVLAQAYANELEDVEVESGTFSALHFAAKAAAASPAGTLRNDTTDNLSVGFTTDVEVLASNTITPDMALEAIKTRAVDGTVTFNIPSNGQGVCYIYLDIDGSGPYTVTLGSSGVKSIGTIPSLAASTTYLCVVTRRSASLATVQIEVESA